MQLLADEVMSEFARQLVASPALAQSRGANSKFSGRRPDEFGLIKVLSTQAQ
jgi:hypothetical protein